MTEQMTPQGVTLLVGAMIVFWVGIAALVRVHGRRRGSTRSARAARETHG